MVERHLLPQSVDFTDVAFGYRLRDNGARNGSQRAVGYLHHVGNVAGYGVDAGQLKAFFCKEKGVEELDVARQHCGGHAEGVDSDFAKERFVDKLPVEAERYFAE